MCINTADDHPLNAARLAAVALVALAVGACGGTQQAGVGAGEIRVSELPPSAQNQSAYEVVQQYKSSWLRGRGRSSINAPQEVSVYLDTGENRYGGPESLKSISAQDVESIERLSSQEAQFQFGMDNTRGVILVHMKDGS
ncbi:MAG: hypothetical protein ABEL97_10685 [Salinibacter sp.]